MEDEDNTYKIVRKFFNTKFSDETILEGLSLEDAKEHCSDPDSSSKSCTTDEGIVRTANCGPWFDAFYRE